MFGELTEKEQLLLKKVELTLLGQSREHDGKVSLEQSDQRWCSDRFVFKCLNGEAVTVTFVMDSCDRAIISFVSKKGKGMPAWMAQEQVISAVNRRFGQLNTVPSDLQLLTDSDSAYIAKATKRLLRSLGIEDCKIAVCSPQSNEMAESMVKTHKRDYLPFIDMMNAEQALASLPAYVLNSFEVKPS
ncbi:MAG: DDE-type integrase/transposase/recombinase [Bacteroidales bacterium]|nr:DDE-type integrase/transposase/recombinase [Bacteroidales bacterium]